MLKVADEDVDREENDGLVKHTLREYTCNTGLHGLRYLGEAHRPWQERCWWAVMILASLSASSLLIYGHWARWNTSPVLVSFMDHATPAWDIPFPTITLCSSVKYEKAIFDFSAAIKINRSIMPLELKRVVDDLLLVCRNLYNGEWYDGEDFTRFTNHSSIEILKRVSPALDNLIGCAGNTYCENMFQTLMTKEGVCHSYNLLPNMTMFTPETEVYDQPPDIPLNPVWSLEHGYKDSARLLDLPLRASGIGFSRGTFFTMFTDHSNLDYACRPIQGFKIALTNPAEIPQMFERYYSLPVKGLTQVAVQPKVMDTSEGLRDYHPDKRHCYFPSERQLRYFSTYTQNNCDLECLTNYTLQVCQCVDFYMPRNSTTPICGVGMTSCVIRAEEELNNEFISHKIHHTESANTCNCLPSCKSIHYTAEISQGTIELDQLFKILGKDVKKYENMSAHFLFVFLKDGEFIATRRQELYGYTDFIASCGGLLGLSCGFSVLSLAELLYYLTFRLWSNIRSQEQSLHSKLNPHLSEIIEKKKVTPVPTGNAWIY